MKQDQITFRMTWQHGTSSDKSFVGYRNSKDQWIHQRDIVMYGKYWREGAYIRFEVHDLFTASPVSEKDGYDKILDVTIFDRDVTSISTKQLMATLASGELRGRIAEDTAYVLYWQLFVMNPKYNKFVPGIDFLREHSGAPKEEVNV